MAYIPNPEENKLAMLRAIGLESMDELFSEIPAQYHLQELKLDRGLSEPELRRELTALAGKNVGAGSPTFLGAGAYDHYIPVIVEQLLLRSEFYTTYTPYQAELSQGILQAIFEFQTLICQLTGMDVANASMYEGASALAEACNLAAEATRKKKILVPDTVNPAYRQVLATYELSDLYELETVMTTGGDAGEALLAAIDDQTAAVILQHPNWFGNLETKAAAIADKAHAHKALLIMAVDPISLGLLKPPAELGADIVVGEGQSLGSPLGFGGPYLGFFAVTAKLMRRIPGRLVGQTTDNAGNRAFVLTLQAREQHIRRERASSNICSNQALVALGATIYLAAVGPRGLKAIAERSHQLAAYAKEALAAQGVETMFSGPFFKEFAVKLADPKEANKRLLAAGIIGGYELPEGMLLAFTEKRTKAEIDRLAEVLGGMKHE